MPQPEIVAALDIPMGLGESPVWDAANALLYWIDIPGKALHRLQPSSGAHQRWDMPSEPGCIALSADGRIVVALRSGIAFFDTKDGVFESIVDAPYDQSRMRFNDGRCDPAGRLVTGTIDEPRDRGDAALYALDRGVLRDLGPRATVSNGVAFSPDGAVLYHADTTTHRISTYRYDLASGTVADGQLFHQFSMERGPAYGGRPDGAAVDSEGAYWCAMMEGGCLLRFAPDGRLLEEIVLPALCPTMLAFGGDDLCTVYVTTARRNRPADELATYPLSGCVLSFRVNVPGRREAYYQPL